MCITPTKASDISEILQKKTEYGHLFHPIKRKYYELCSGFQI